MTKIDTTNMSEAEKAALTDTKPVAPPTPPAPPAPPVEDAAPLND